MEKHLDRAYRLALILPLFILLIIGCQRDLIVPGLEKTEATNLTIEEAKIYFKENVNSPNVIAKQNGQSTTMDEILKNKEALWQNAYNSILTNGKEAVRIPLNIKNDVYWKLGNNPNSRIHFNLLNYLFMYRDSISTIHTEWVTLMPDSAWLEGNRNKYLGKILIKDWNGNRLRIYDFTKDGKISESNVTTTSGGNAKTQIMFDTECYWSGCGGAPNGRVSTDCQETLNCETIITDGGGSTSGWDPWGGNNPNGSGSSGSGGTGTGGGGNNYTPTCNPSISPGTSVGSHQLPPCIPITQPGGGLTPGDLGFTPISYTQQELESIIENLNDPITGQGVSLFLVENYKGSKAIKAVYSHVAGDNITVGDYTLAKNYDASGNLISYYAWRNATNGVEYMIKANQLDAFRDNIDYYTSAANLVYFDGPPSQSMIALMSEDYVNGLISMWGEALTDPNYYIYVANVLVMSSANVKPNNITYRNVTTGVSIPNFEITSHTFSQYKNLIQQKLGGTWQTVATSPLGPIQVLEVGNIKYNARPIAHNPNYNLTIDYFRNGRKIGEFRFNN